MPTYSYSCKDCGHAFDVQQAFSDDSLTVCPNCSGSLRKIFSAVGVVFKGSGFYRTDSRGNGSSASSGSSSGSSGGSDSSGSGSSSGKGSSSSEAKPAAASTSSGSSGGSSTPSKASASSSTGTA